jgi:hypothetical protein
MSVTQTTNVNNKVIPEGITRFETYQNGQPLYGGVNDPRMGTFDKNSRCKTCDCTYTGSGSAKVRGAHWSRWLSMCLSQRTRVVQWRHGSMK